MAMNETAMAALVKANIEAVTDWPNAGETPAFLRDDILVAFCKGIIDHIKAAMDVASAGSDSHGDSVTTTSTAVT